MSLLLSHLKSYDTKNTDTGRKVPNAKAASAAGNVARVSGGREFVKGEVVKGQVTDLRSNQATIKLSDGSVIQGRMEQDVDLYIGQTANFEVTKSSENGIQLKIVHQEESKPNENLTGKALIQAGLPLSDKNREVVGALLDSNLSVDKQSIMQFLKMAHQFPEAEIKDLVFLQKHNIPVNETNLYMLQEYQGSEHRIVSQLQSLTNGLVQMFADGVDEGTGKQLLQFALQVPEYSENSGEEQTLQNNQGLSPEANGVQQIGTNGQNVEQGEQVLQTTGQNSQDASGVPASETILQSETQVPQAENHGTAATGLSGQQVQTDIPLSQITQTPQATEQLATAQNAGNLGDTNGMNQIQSTAWLESTTSEVQPQIGNQFDADKVLDLAQNLKSAGAPVELVRQVKEGNITGHELLKEVYELSENSQQTGSKTGLLKELMQNESLQKIFKDELLRNYTLSPKQVMNGENVKKFYAKLEQDVEKMNQLLQNGVRNEEAARLSGQTEHLKNNLDFMKTLNQIYPYIQLPVRLKDQNIHSELYVFTKRKGKLSNMEDISLLLHLDMEHLGGLDIHLQMNKSNLKAKFYVENDEVEHLFESTISELGDVLEEKGYHLHPEFYQQKQTKSAFDEMILQEQASEGMTMKRYTFDIRA